MRDGAIIVHSGEEEAAFSFDACFDSSAAQHDVYSDLVAGPMAALFDGFNCTIFEDEFRRRSDVASPAHRARSRSVHPKLPAPKSA